MFDLRLRNGNQDQWHGSGQLGFLGTEVLAEGPLNREKRSSFLINYRYSTAVIFSALGIDIGTSAVPRYQDGSFKLHVPTGGGGAFSLWGLGGNSSVDILISDQVRPERNIYGDNDRDQFFRTGMGIVGATYTKPINEKTYLKTTLAVSRDWQDSRHEFVSRDLSFEGGDTTFTNVSTQPLMAYLFDKKRVSLAAHANRKLDVERGTATLRFGLNADAMLWAFNDSIKPFVWQPDPNMQDSTLTLGEFGRRWDANMTSLLVQPFAQVKWRPSEPWTVTAGLHAMADTRSGAMSLLEPRLGAQYVTAGGTVWSAGAGLHSQMQTPYLYATSPAPYPSNGDALAMPNANMDFTKSMHTVVGMSRRLGDLWTMKAEAYFQHLYDIPVADTTTAWGAANTSYSLINAGGGFDRLFPGFLGQRRTRPKLRGRAHPRPRVPRRVVCPVHGKRVRRQIHGRRRHLPQHRLQWPLRVECLGEQGVEARHVLQPRHRRQVHHGGRSLVRGSRHGTVRPVAGTRVGRRHAQHPAV